MTSDEAEAYSWLEKRFWENVIYNQYHFLWLPEYNAKDGGYLWLCKAVKVVSREAYWRPAARLSVEYAQVRWYKPKDFLIERLSV